MPWATILPLHEARRRRNGAWLRLDPVGTIRRGQARNWNPVVALLGSRFAEEEVGELSAQGVSFAVLLIDAAILRGLAALFRAFGLFNEVKMG